MTLLDLPRPASLTPRERLPFGRVEWTPRRVRDLRAHLGISAVAMATRIGVTPVTVMRWEMTNPSPRNQRGPSHTNRLKLDRMAYESRFVPREYLCPDPSAHEVKTA